MEQVGRGQQVCDACFVGQHRLHLASYDVYGRAVVCHCPVCMGRAGVESPGKWKRDL